LHIEVTEFFNDEFNIHGYKALNEMTDIINSEWLKKWKMLMQSVLFLAFYTVYNG